MNWLESTFGRELGLIAILLAWAGLLFLVRKWKGDVSMTFSQHAAQEKSSILYYVGLWAVLLPLFYVFFIKWLAPTYDLPSIFTSLASVSLLGMLVAVCVPETSGWRVPVHRFAAFAMASLFVLLIILLGASPLVSEVARLACFGTAVLLLIEIAILARGKGRHPKILFIQGSYIAIFHIALLVTVYL